jgi:pimeloyl-[acyl-carrier protein] synthase
MDGPYWLPHGGGTGGMWLFTRYEDAGAVLKEVRIAKDVSRLLPPEELTLLDQSMLFRDAPDHARLRALSNQAFSPARVRNLEPRILEIVDGLLARVRSKGAMDFIADFALPLPIMVIAELLGVPQEDRDKFRAWSSLIARGVDMVRASEEDVRNQREATIALMGCFTDLMRQRRLQPREDIISGLLEAHDQGDRLSEAELLGTCILLLIAGHETTIHLLGNGLYTLLRHPDQLALLKQRPELIASTVEEILRFEGPAQRATFRFARETFVFQGATITQGQQVSAVLGAANRDPAQFPDADRFDIMRDPNRHLGFGVGMHFCLGASLARAEARIGFTRLLEALPNLRMMSDTPDWQPSTFFRGLKTLPVTF